MESGMRDVRGMKTTAAGPRALSAGPPWGAHPAVLHLDIDAFFAAVEQLRNPALRGRPVVVGSGVVASASYEARRYGIRAGTPLHAVARLCPQAVVVAGHAPTYRAFAERVFALAAELAPQVETYLDDALLDLTGTERLHGHLIRAAAGLQRRIRAETGLGVALGMGTNRMVARMVTRLAKPGGFAWLRPGGEAAFVARRPVGELPVIGPRRERLLHEMGITTVAELRAFTPAQLRDLFGEVGLLLAARARGEETRAVAPREVPHSIRRETSYDEAQTDTTALEGMLHYLAERAAAQARRVGVVPGLVRVHLRWSDGARVARGMPLARADLSTAALYGAARRLLQMLRTRRRGIRNFGLELSELELAGRPQLGLFDAASAGEAQRAATAPGRVPITAEARLDRVADELRERFGFRALVRGASLELLERLPSDAHGFVLRTPCLTR